MHGCKVETVNNADEFWVSRFEPHLIKTHYKMVIPDKHGRNVPVILNDFIQEALQCLLGH